jgi:hypothetical protein
MYKKLLLSVLAASVFSIGTAEAGERWSHFRRMLPKIYLYTEEPVSFYEDEDIYYDQRRVVLREDYYEPEYLYDDEEYLPPKPKKKIYKQTVKKTVPKIVPKPVAKAAAVKKPILASTSKPPAVAKKPIVTAAIIKPNVLPTKPESSSTVSCTKASEIVAGFGFARVVPKSCVGNVYAFKAVRGGKAYEIGVSAANGELTAVKKLQ